MESQLSCLLDLMELLQTGEGSVGGEAGVGVHGGRGE